MRVKFLIAAFAISIFLNLPQPVYSQEGEKQMKRVQGEVVSSDWVGSKFALKWYPDPESSVYDEMSFTVTSSAKVTKGTDPATLSDIEQGNHVVVNYYFDKYGFQKVVSIMVLAD